MQVNGLPPAPLSPQSPLTLSTVEPLLRVWQVGQVLDAVVLERTTGDPLRLRIGGQEVQAQTELTPAPGTRLRLQVIATDSPVVLKVLQEAVSQESIGSALRLALPRQAPLAPLLANLSALAQGAGQQLPADIVRLGQGLFQQLATPDTLADAQAMRRALLDGGLLLEAKLAQEAATGQGASLAGDLKAGLLRLAQALQVHAGTQAAPPAVPHGPSHEAPAPLQGTLPKGQGPAPASLPDLGSGALGELSRQTEAALARLQVAQLASLPLDGSVEGGQAAGWIFELPLRRVEGTSVVQVRIERPREHAGTGAAGWAVWIGLELDSLGAVHARLSLHGQTVSATFWAERETTAALVSAHLRELSRRLAEAGLCAGGLACRTGLPPVPSAQHRPGLVDESA